MEVPRKLSLRRVEMSLTKFNDVAVPHHLDLLRQHRHNIAKFSEAGELNRVKSEQLNACRVVSQLRNLLSEMEHLRRQVRDEELDKFDHMTQRSRLKTIQACTDYLDHPPVHDIPARRPEPSVPSASVQSTLSTESIGTVLAPSVQLVVDRTELEEERLRQKEECLEGWETLQREVQDLYEVYTKFHRLVEDQKPQVDLVGENVEVTAANVDLGRRSLAKAERLKLTMYPIAGAVIGGCLAGPLGLVVGIKVASAALIGGSILGFTGGSFLRKRREAVEGMPMDALEKDESGESKKDK